MDVLLDEWPWFLNIYKARLLQICYVMYFCNVYAWILIKYQLHFDFLVVFTLLVRPCQLLYHVSWLLKSVFLFFVLTSGRPLRVTTFFVFSKPLCSADRDSGIFCTAAKALFIAVKGLSTAARNSQNLLLLQPALLQLFCSASWSHSAALQQRSSFRTGAAASPNHRLWNRLSWHPDPAGDKSSHVYMHRQTWSLDNSTVYSSEIILKNYLTFFGFTFFFPSIPFLLFQLPTTSSKSSEGSLKQGNKVHVNC